MTRRTTQRFDPGPLAFRYERGALHLPQFALWLDGTTSRRGPERVFVSHAHSDHIAAHREVFVTAPTARFLEARLKGTRTMHVLKFGEPREVETDSGPAQLTLLPAGHVLGSAMAFLEAAGRSLLYTGDFKLHRGLTAEPCELRQADLLIMETTFGRPKYRLPPAGGVWEEIVAFCREGMERDETPVLLAYSLGKSQELVRGLTAAGLPALLQTEAFQLAKIYEACGCPLGSHGEWKAGVATTGHVIICSPMARHRLAGLGKTRTAVVTGWAMDSSCRYRFQVDRAFALSDHADFDELREAVRRVSPKRVFTLHGFAAEFAQTLRDEGWDAHALSEPDQMSLPLFRE